MSGKSRRGVFLVGVCLAALMTGCVDILTIEPQEAVNPVGTEHTVTGTYTETDIDICEIIPIICNPFPFAAVPLDNFFFEIIEGPNAGLQSDGDCGPGGDDPCYIEPPEGAISWTYRGSGGPGTDIIQFCPLIGPSIEESKAMLSEAVTVLAERAGISRADFLEPAEPGDGEPAIQVDPGCVGATKTWVVRESVDRSQPNIGAGLSGLFQGQPTALPTAPAPVATAPSPVIRPPNTGDAGLK